LSDRRRDAGWALLAAVVPLAVFARMVAHPEALRDGEGAIPWTIGRELAQCGLAPLLHLQLVPYQGSLIVDSLLSAGLYRTLGDHLLSGYGVGLLWAYATAAAGALWLLRAAGPRAAGLWVALLATAPLITKDALAAIIGGHAAAPAFALAAGALLAGGVRPRRALLAGALIGFGAWYVRTAVLGAVVVLWMVRKGGRSAIAAALIGLAVGPALIGANAAALCHVDAAVAQGSLGPFLSRTVLPGADQVGEQTAGERIGQATGWRLRRSSYARPTPATGGQPEPLAAGVAAGTVQSATTVLGALLLLGLARRRESLAPIAVLLVTFGAVAARLPPLPPEIAAMLGPGSIRVSPPPNPLRYLAALTIVQVFAASAALGSAPRGPWFAAPAIALGLVAAVADARRPEPHPPLHRLSPAWYQSLQLTGREPPAHLLQPCDRSDDDSRAWRRRMLGQGAAQMLVGPSGIDVEAVREFAATEPSGEAWAGAGQAAADQARGGLTTADALLASLPAALAALTPHDPVGAQEFGPAVAAAAPDDWLPSADPEVLDALCRFDAVCDAIGGRFAGAGARRPDHPAALFGLDVTAWDALPAATRRGLTRGAARGLRGRPEGAPRMGESTWGDAEETGWNEAR